MKTKKQVLPLQGSRSIFNISIPLLSPVETTVPCKENRESNIQEDYETLLLTLLTCNLFTFICIVENTDAPYFAQSKTQRSWEVTAVFQIQYIKKKKKTTVISLFFWVAFLGNYGKTWLAVLGRTFLKHFPSVLVKCWLWPVGQFWNPVALV